VLDRRVAGSSRPPRRLGLRPSALLGHTSADGREARRPILGRRDPPSGEETARTGPHARGYAFLDRRFWYLPGADLIDRGLGDLAAGRRSEFSLLLAIGAPRLGERGIAVEASWPCPEHELYELLGSVHGDGAHAAYNSLIGRLVSFEWAAAADAPAR
jgi:hypothetical protein